MKKILVVENNKQNMYLMSRILKNAGYEVLEAWSGEESVEVAAKKKPDLILMDIQLSGIDGLEATKRIIGLEMEKKVPIIAVTSYAMAGDREKFLAAGCIGYIEKPIDPDTFITEIKKYLNA